MEKWVDGNFTVNESEVRNTYMKFHVHEHCMPNPVTNVKNIEMIIH